MRLNQMPLIIKVDLYSRTPALISNVTTLISLLCSPQIDYQLILFLDPGIMLDMWSAYI